MMNWYKIAKLAEDIWANVDWNKSNDQLAQELGVSYSGIRYQRYIRDLNYRRPSSVRGVNCEDIDWSRSSEDIAYDYGVDRNTIATLRRRCAPYTINTNATPTGINWDIIGTQIDWKNRTNVSIAIELGTSPSLVSTERVRFAPETLKHRGGSFYDWKNIDWNKSNKEIVQYLIEKHHIDPIKVTPVFLSSLYHMVSSRRHRVIRENEMQRHEDIPQVASSLSWYKKSQIEKEPTDKGSDIICPFCDEPDFDLAGLKNHLQSGYCEVYNSIDVSSFRSFRNI